MTKSLFNSPNLISNIHGRVVTMTIAHDDIKIIEKYKSNLSPRRLTTYCKEVIDSSIRWMERMINGPELFEIDSMDAWEYDRENDKLLLRIYNQTNQQPTFDMSFTKGTLEEYNQGLATLLSSFWYKSYAPPHVVVELIACCDLLYREHHNNASPAVTARVPYPIN